jgi:uncharacterized protein involved in exopolysaccharide biosynthesis
MQASPKVYQAVARTKLSPPAAPGPIQTEFEVIWSEVVLGKVIEKLNLAEEWGRKRAGGAPHNRAETIQVLKPKIELRVVPNTELLEIRVRSDGPEEAARIANTVAEVFQKLRQDQNRRLRLEEEKARTNAWPLRGTSEDPVLIDDPMVMIVDLARAPTRPIRPNRPLGATVFFLGFLLVVVGMVWGLADRSDPSPPTERG